MAASVDEVANAMYDMVKEYHGKKNLKAMDLSKAMREKFGEDNCDKKLCKLAIRQIIESGKCTYSYVGGSYVVLNPEYKG
jgi:ribosomal protein L37AE/L43A